MAGPIQPYDFMFPFPPVFASGHHPPPPFLAALTLIGSFLYKCVVFFFLPKL